MQGRDTRKGALHGLKVVELGQMVAAPFCAKLLADLGADVVKVEEPQQGDPARRSGSFPDDDPHPEKSALFLYLNTSKRSITLDLETKAGRGTLRRLVSRADVLIEDHAPGELERLGIGYPELSDDVPGLVMTSITPFGQTGPDRNAKAHHLNLYHAGGHSMFWAAPAAEKLPPPCGPGHLGDYDGGLTAAVATLAAAFARRLSGRGCHIDISKQEAMMCLERVDIGLAANNPKSLSRPRMVGGLMKAKDGYFVITAVQEHQWRGVVRAMGDPRWASAEWCKDEDARAANRERIQAHLQEWAADLDRDEIYHRCQAEGAPVGPVLSVSEVRTWKQAEARAFFQELDHAAAGRQVYPTAPYLFSRAPWEGRPAPLLGEHNAEVLREELDMTGEEDAPAESRSGRGRRGPMSVPKVEPLPLAGVRVVDFTWAWAGPHGTLLLAMLGAEVIKIESRTRLDHSRLRSLMAGSVKVEPDESALFNHLNLRKLSLTLNLRTESARDTARRLVAVSDVVTQNMRPGVLDRLGLGYEDLARVKRDIILLSSSAVGAIGPESTYAGYAPTFASLSGAAHLTGYPDQSPVPLSGSVDLRVGTASAFAVLAALHHRERTGEGQDIDLSSTEVMSSMIGEAFLQYSQTGDEPGRRGNRHSTMAPHGCYRCRGEESWVTIAVDGADEWEAFKAAVADPNLDDDEFDEPRRRWQNQDKLDEIVEAWTIQHQAQDVVATLQAAGVAAMPLHDAHSLARDSHIAARGVMQSVEHPRIGTNTVVGAPWKFDGCRTESDHPAPLLGQHNDYVLRGILGLDDDEIDRLQAEDALS